LHDIDIAEASQICKAIFMAKVGRNAPCPCGSGKKYKKCCLLRKDGKTQTDVKPMRFIPVFTELDQLSNSVVDLIKQNRLDEAEAASRKLLTDYPDQIDGLNRLAMVYEARGEKSKAADYYQKAAAFAKSKPDFDKQMVNWFLSEARRMQKAMQNNITEG
jgi:tetratricopeptide (TPR) repeat protein